MGMSLAVESRECIQARRTLSLALDGEAVATDVLVAASHLRRCERCSQFAAYLVAFTRELRADRPERRGTQDKTEHSRGERP
jgi:predicted anti-sigma-YlaC factor YlaD